ncbi:MAG: hypothetical protein HFH93_05850 [Lachnospiraceae bacterium]|nr:hypothetical protein [Lachnospiraceae bacterium]
MGRIIKTLIIEQREGSNGKEQSYNFMFEQRGEEALVLNIDTGVCGYTGAYIFVGRIKNKSMRYTDGESTVISKPYAVWYGKRNCTIFK